MSAIFICIRSCVKPRILLYKCVFTRVHNIHLCLHLCEAAYDTIYSPAFAIFICPGTSINSRPRTFFLFFTYHDQVPPPARQTFLFFTYHDQVPPPSRQTFLFSIYYTQVSHQPDRPSSSLHTTIKCLTSRTDLPPHLYTPRSSVSPAGPAHAPSSSSLHTTIKCPTSRPCLPSSPSLQISIKYLTSRPCSPSWI